MPRISSSRALRTATVIPSETAIASRITLGISQATARKSAAALFEASCDSDCSSCARAFRRWATSAKAVSALLMALALIDWSSRAISITSRTACT